MKTINGFTYHTNDKGFITSVVQGNNKALDRHMEAADWSSQNPEYWTRHWEIEERIYRKERAKADNIYFEGA